MTRAPWRVVAGVSGISCAILMQEIALSRILSATSWYHFAFLVISIALFGLSGAAVALHLTPGLHRSDLLRRHLMLYATLFSLTTVLLAVVLLWTPLAFIAFSRGLGPLLLLFLVGGFPFFAGGMCLALVISRLSHDVNRIYAADLIGAGTGCVLAVPALSLLGGGGTLLLTAFLGSLVAVAFADATARNGPLVPVGLVVVLLVAIGVHARTGSFDVRYPKSTTLVPTPQFVEWNAHSRVTVNPASSETSTRASETCPPPPPALSILIDSSAETQILVAESINEVTYLRCEITALSYVAAPPGSKALIIGPGGGKEVWTALLYNAHDVTGVEINAIIVKEVMTAFATQTGGLYERPDVSIEIADARSYIRSSTRTFDVIQASQVDTWAATSAGALALSENTLYTTEAFVDYFMHLTAEGLLSMTRWVGDDTLRIISTVRAAGIQLGWPDHENHMFIAAEPMPDTDLAYRATVVVTNEPLATEQVVALEQFAQVNGFDVLYSPSGIGAEPFSSFVTVDDLNRLLSILPRDLSPVTDDRPFFFQTARIGDPINLVRSALTVGSSDGLFLAVRLLIVTGAVVALFLFGPLWLGRGRSLSQSLPGSALGYFALLGTGFIIVEISLMQRFILFLGHPTYALTVVLFALLTGGGLGSRLSRAVRIPTKGAVVACSAVAVLSASYGVGLPALFDRALSWPVSGRVGLAALLLLPLGIVLGVPLPAGVRSVGDRRAGALAWVWAVNGATSVFGSVLAVILAITVGFTVTAVVGAIAYALAALTAVRMNDDHHPARTSVVAAA